MVSPCLKQIILGSLDTSVYHTSFFIVQVAGVKENRYAVMHLVHVQFNIILYDGRLFLFHFSVYGFPDLPDMWGGIADYFRMECKLIFFHNTLSVLEF